MGWNPFTWGGNQVMGAGGYGDASIGGDNNQDQQLSTNNTHTPIDGGGEKAVDNIMQKNPGAFEFNWGQYGDREGKARKALEFSQEYGGSKHFNPSTGKFDSWKPGDEKWFSEVGMKDEYGVPISYQDFISGHQEMGGEQSTLHQKELERSKPFGKFKWGEGLLNAATNLTDTAANNKAFEYELF